MRTDSRLRCRHCGLLLKWPGVWHWEIQLPKGTRFYSAGPVLNDFSGEENGFERCINYLTIPGKTPYERYDKPNRIYFRWGDRLFEWKEGALILCSAS